MDYKEKMAAWMQRNEETEPYLVESSRETSPATVKAPSKTPAVVDLTDSPPVAFKPSLQNPQHPIASHFFQPYRQVSGASAGSGLTQLENRAPAPDARTPLNAKAQAYSNFDQNRAPTKIVPSDPLADYRPRPTNGYVLPSAQPIESYAIDAVDETRFGYERITDEQAEKDLRELVEGAYEGENASDVDEAEATPEGLTCKLLPHQVKGVAWMLGREKGKKRGGILADDMGLGKTIQSIALIAGHRQEKKGEPKTTLVVCPLALIHQWEEEVANKSDDLSVAVYHGNDRHKLKSKLHKYRVIITTYDVVSREFVDEKKLDKEERAQQVDSDSDDSEFGAKGKKKGKKGSTALKSTWGPLYQREDGTAMTWWRVILDEAHRIKNRSAKQTKACWGLKSTYRWCLTGTPIQNSVEDLFALFHFLGSANVKPLHDYPEFKARILSPMKRNKAKVSMQRVQIVLRTILLRRTKDSTDSDGKPLLKLPEKEIILLKTPFRDPDEAAFYEAVAQKMELQMNKFLKDGTAMNHYIDILTLLLRMRQAVLHPALVTKDKSIDKDAIEAKMPRVNSKGKLLDTEADEDGVDELADALGSLDVKTRRCELCTEDLPVDHVGKHCDSCARRLKMAKKFEGMESSTKISRLLELLDEIADEDRARPKKTIVFSQFTSFLDLIEPFIRKAGYGYTRYDGSMRADAKADALDRIKNDPKCVVLLISLKCGAVGLNLTCCSRLAMLDPWWNPAIESQAWDRSHRFGQRDKVKCFKITIEGTVEDKILTLQEQKQSIANQALGAEEAKKLNKLSMQELMFLFKSDH